jgi:hypothetical protein
MICHKVRSLQKVRKALIYKGNQSHQWETPSLWGIEEWPALRR